uniref:ATP synthase complex subunit 8 n=1 Tax=Birgus latro TaxID=177283 RepID=A0A3Q8B8N2_9EUCA|nr:ATP synthase F0 subunit 8 [Birgus latro]ASS30705.1 ATP synthase F0 subunit 8 [Birgus latro]QES95349.1 ATP synthase F0 subunit 8 [Birgus latro]
MPQMAPILWLNLTFMFLLTFIIFIIMNYFIKIPSKISPKEETIFISEKTWKW